jgi:two-component system, cell cycle sensor histidine kinase and response regulator CckA
MVCVDGLMLKPLPEEQRLRAELERARGALAHMQEVARLGTWERDETTGIAEWSQGLESLLGFGPQTGRALETWLALVHPEDRARVAETIHAGVAHGPGYRYECRIRVGGEERLMHVDALTTRDAAGRPIRVNGIVQDITDWQRSEAALAQSEAVQSAVVDAALDSVVVMNAHGLVVEWNKAAESTFGWSRAEAVGQELAALIIPPAHRSAHRRALAAHGAEESGMLGRRLELTALRRDGSEFPVEVAVGPVHGERPLFAGYLRDITERKQAEEARRAAESRWRALVEQIPAVTYLGRFDEEATMIYISPQVERLTGFAPETWTDDPGFWLSRVHPEDVESATRESEARFRERRGFSCTYRMRRADGAWVWIEEQSTILYDDEGEPRYLQGVMVDVSERRRRDEELTAAQRLESIGQLAGGVAHDFNNLLGIIQGYAELLELEVPESSQSDVKEIRRAAERAADLTRQLLLFGRRESAEAGVVDANEVVAELRNMLQRTLGEHVDLVLDLAPAAGLVLMPAGQLEQILVNLVVNARDAMPGGGRLKVSTAVGGQGVSLRVTDSGTGMTDDVATRAFDPFFTTKEKGRGTGLGLATVYGIVQGAGGRVWLDTVPGQGTTVEIELPLAEEQSMSGDERPAPPLTGRGETVLVVEDEAAVRQLTGRILSENGYRVIDAADGYRARILCDQFQGEIDLLLSDVVMPGMSGRQVAEQLRSLRPELRVLYMSGHAGDVLDHHGLAGPEMPLLQKPFDTTRLLASVRAALS